MRAGGRSMPLFAGLAGACLPKPNWRSLLFCFQAEDGIRDTSVTGVQTCARPISPQPGVQGVAGVGADDVAHLAEPPDQRVEGREYRRAVLRADVEPDVRLAAG